MTVADAALSATATPVSATEGQAFSGNVARFTDADPAGALGDYWATIDWGDGHFGPGTITTDPNGGFDVTGINTFTGPGPYTTTVQIHDQGGAVTSVSGAVTVAVPPPLISIVATQPSANASGGISGTFTVSRTGDTTRALSVNYLVAGTAVGGIDYQPLPGSVVIPAGSSSATFSVSPSVDPNPLIANPTSVVVALSPPTAVPPAYTVGGQSLTATDTVTQTITGTQTGIVASPRPSLPAAVLQLSGVSSATAGTSFSITVTALTAGGLVATGYGGTVQFSSSDSQAALPSNYTFTAADAGVHTFTVTLKTARPAAYVNVSDTVNAGLVGWETTDVVPGAVN